MIKKKFKGQCGDQQRCKHELTSEKAYLNQLELTKLKSVLYELRFNLIKNGLASAQFGTRLAKCKLESYLREFIAKFQTGAFDIELNNQLKVAVDILFYFYRKQNKNQYQSEAAAAGNKSNQKSGKSSSDNKSNIYYEIDDNDESLNSSENTSKPADTSGEISKSANFSSSEINYEKLKKF